MASVYYEPARDLIYIVRHNSRNKKFKISLQCALFAANITAIELVNLVVKEKLIRLGEL